MLLWVALAVASDGLTVKPGCQASCGGVDIPYPFGIGAGCFRHGFEIGCDSDKPSLPGNTTWSVGIPVLSLSVMPRPEARVMLPVAFQCFNSTGDTTDFSYGMVDFNSAGVYRISNTHNELFVLGCNTQIYINSGPPGRYRYSYYTGCVAYCNDSRSAKDGACAGIGCCHVDIPPGLTSNWMNLASGTEGYAWSHVDQEFSPCDYVFKAITSSRQTTLQRYAYHTDHAAPARLGNPRQQHQLHRLHVLMRTGDQQDGIYLRQRP
jgi:hypothetical protein